MAKAGKNDSGEALNILELQTGCLEVCILGQTPLVYHRMAEKAKRELLMPRGRMTTADKIVNVKHDPMAEYRDSLYQSKIDDAPTRLFFPGAAFKKACAAAALDIPGASKAQIGRLMWVDQYNVDIYGIPEIFAAVVRMADIKKTPDIRFRGILPRWACKVKLHYVMPHLTTGAVGNLLAAAGMIVGIGDGRQEKGSLSFGQFRLVDEDDPQFLAVVAGGGRAAQDRAIADPAYLDDETGELCSWYNSEVVRRKSGGGKTKLREVA